MRLACLSLVFCLVLPMLVGCNVISGTVAVLAPPEKVDAKYELPDKATLIVVDDPRDLVASPSTLRLIASATRNVLEKEEVVVLGGFIPQDALSTYRGELGEQYNGTSLAALGIHLGAKQVIHAEVTGFQVGIGGNVIRPQIALNVKVYDIDQRKRVFPTASGIEESVDVGATVYPLQSQLPVQDVTGQSATRSIAIRDLANQTGRDIARLFFTWRKPQPGSELGNNR